MLTLLRVEVPVMICALLFSVLDRLLCHAAWIRDVSLEETISVLPTATLPLVLKRTRGPLLPSGRVPKRPTLRFLDSAPSMAMEVPSNQRQAEMTHAALSQSCAWRCFVGSRG